MGIRCFGNSKVYINSGEINANRSTAIELSDNSYAEITGGTITGIHAIYCLDSANYRWTGGTINGVKK